MSEQLSLGACASFACLLEVTSPKVGNVHRGADFADVTYADFVASAMAIGPVFEQAGRKRCGELALAAVRATKIVCHSNTNLGAILLLAPLSKAASTGRPIATAMSDVLANLNSNDAHNVYEAIRLASPGGMGAVEASDIAGSPPASLIAAMQLAAPRDLVAAQFANDFREVHVAAERVLDGISLGLAPLAAIFKAQLELMKDYPDSLIARKCGPAVARQAADHAAEVLSSGPFLSAEFWQAAGDLDFWLRSDGNRRNPGTTADLLAAGLFMLLWEDRLHLPFDWSLPGET